VLSSAQELARTVWRSAVKQRQSESVKKLTKPARPKRRRKKQGPDGSAGYRVRRLALASRVSWRPTSSLAGVRVHTEPVRASLITARAEVEQARFRSSRCPDYSYTSTASVHRTAEGRRSRRHRAPPWRTRGTRRQSVHRDLMRP
jgi:hypothetical protein